METFLTHAWTGLICCVISFFLGKEQGYKQFSRWLVTYYNVEVKPEFKVWQESLDSHRENFK